MANDEHIAQLEKGVAAWNAWRDENPDVRPDLLEASLRGAHLFEANLGDADLRRANLRGANLRGANLRGAWLRRVDLNKADLSDANLYRADLIEAKLIEAKLIEAYFSEANLRGASLGGANLMGANLRGANLSEANLRDASFNEANLREAGLEFATMANADFTGADLTGCHIYGASAWSLKLEGATQQNLIITRAPEESKITVDNIEVAQFVYLMLNNRKIREVIDTITSKAVLILGRFTDERKAVLDALREELRERNYLPILFDFENPRSRDTDETITLLARMARFIVADISDAKSVLHELRAIVPDLPSVPVQPIILETQEEPGMFDFYRNRPSFLPVHRYASQKQLIADLGEKVIRPAELKVVDLRGST
jgi:uncharacterized protein YjbI with pentapeptide repeats